MVDNGLYISLPSCEPEVESVCSSVKCPVYSVHGVANPKYIFQEAMIEGISIALTLISHSKRNYNFTEEILYYRISLKIGKKKKKTYEDILL